MGLQTLSQIYAILYALKGGGIPQTTVPARYSHKGDVLSSYKTIAFAPHPKMHAQSYATHFTCSAPLCHISSSIRTKHPVYGSEAKCLLMISANSFVCHSQSCACLDFMAILAVRSNISHKIHIPLLQISGLLMMARSVSWSECAVLG